MGTYTPHFNLYKPSIDETGWGNKVNQNFDIIDEKLFIAGFEKVAEIEVDSDCTYVEFTNLDGNSAWFYVLFATIKNSSSSSSFYNLFVNGDNNETNYYQQYIFANGDSLSSERQNNAYVGSTGSNNFVSFDIFITKNPGGYFTASSKEISYVSSDIKNSIRQISKIATIDNIISLRIQSTVSNAIGAGSKFILFKARRG